MLNTSSEQGSARRQKTRDRLLEAALDVFAEVGVDAAPVELIAERAGFTRGAFYSNFDSKAELFMALAERENTKRLEQVHVGIETVLPDMPTEMFGGTLDQKHSAVTETVAAFLRLQGDDRQWCLIEAEFRMQALRNPEFGRYFAEYNQAMLERLGTVLVDALGALGMRLAIEPLTAARMIVSTYHSFAEEALMTGAEAPTHDNPDLQASIAALVTFLVEPKL